jgi:MoxR-like ATPase
MVLATQNPIEQEGTYPLPEAQMDRFLMHVMVEYPDTAAEVQILRLVREEEGTPASADDPAKIAQQVVFDARREIQNVAIAEAIDTYIVALISATRDPGRYSDQLKMWIHVGASPRGAIALDKVSRAYAWLNGRDFVSPDDVRAVVHDCLRHRIILSYEANAEGITADRIIKEIVTQVAVA